MPTRHESRTLGKAEKHVKNIISLLSDNINLNQLRSLIGLHEITEALASIV